MVAADTPDRPTVHKFGGSALEDPDRIAQVVRIVAGLTGPRVVVASAFGGVTDVLRTAADRVRDEADVVPILDGLRTRHQQALAAVAPDDAAAHTDLDDAFTHLERLLYGIAFTQEPTPRLRDRLQAFGEQLSTLVLAAALRQAGVDAAALGAEDAGVRTQGPYGKARPDLDAIRNAVPDALRPHLAAGRVPVVTGFYGVDGDGHPTLFGRGGSDYVAALVAAAMDAQALHLWKDVPGFLTADPRAVEDAVLVPELDYGEAAELAYFGSRLLHPRAVEPVQGAGIPVRIRSFLDPGAAGSTIHADAAPAADRVRSAASRDGLAILRLEGPGMVHAPGVARRVFTALEEAGVNVHNMANSQASFALLLDDGDADRAHDALQPLTGGSIQAVRILRDRSLVCVVGRGLGETPGSAAEILRTVADADVNVEMISLGASDIAIDFIVPSDARGRALRSLHGRFLAGKQVEA